MIRRLLLITTLIANVAVACNEDGSMEPEQLKSMTDYLVMMMEKIKSGTKEGEEFEGNRVDFVGTLFFGKDNRNYTQKSEYKDTYVELNKFLESLKQYPISYRKEWYEKILKERYNFEVKTSH